MQPGELVSGDPVIMIVMCPVIAWAHFRVKYSLTAGIQAHIIVGQSTKKWCAKFLKQNLSGALHENNEVLHLDLAAVLPVFAR